MSEDKIIDRRNRLIEMAKVEALPYTPFYYILEENISDINYLLYEKKKLETCKQALLDIKTLIQHYGNEEKILDIINKALGDKENE